MIEVIGEYGKAKIFHDDYEENAIKQIYQMMNHPIAENSKVRFMSDYHAGAGAVIGTTMELGKMIIPNLIGVDIGCGVLVYNLGKEFINYEVIQEIIDSFVPSGRNIGIYPDNPAIPNAFREEVEEVCEKIGMSAEYAFRSLGTLGGGRVFAPRPRV